MFIPDPQHSILLIYLEPTESTYCTVPQPTFSSQKIERKAVLHGSALHCKVGSGSTQIDLDLDLHQYADDKPKCSVADRHHFDR
jgi:hypothetical protein